MAAEHKKHGTHGTAQREEAGINRRNAIGEGWKWDRVRMGDRRRRVDWTDWDKEISQVRVKGSPEAAPASIVRRMRLIAEGVREYLRGRKGRETVCQAYGEEWYVGRPTCVSA